MIADVVALGQTEPVAGSRDSRKNTAPRIDPLVLDDLADGDPGSLDAHGTYEGLRWAHIASEGDDLSGAQFSECEFTDWNAHETQLRGARFREVRIERLNAPVFNAARLTLHDVELTASRFGSAELYESELQGVTVADSKFGWANLRGAELQDVVFRNCIFDELDLGGATLTRVSFDDCTIERLIVANATAQHLDLRGVELRAVEGVTGLRGSMLTHGQLASMTQVFADHIGIDAHDD